MPIPILILWVPSILVILSMVAHLIFNQNWTGWGIVGSIAIIILEFAILLWWTNRTEKRCY